MSVPRLEVVAAHDSPLPCPAWCRALLVGAAGWSVAAEPLGAQSNGPIIGRWDLTVQGVDVPDPSWLEVSLSGSRTLVGRFVGGGGSARPIARVTCTGGTMRFAIPPQWDRDTADLVAEATLAADTLRGPGEPLSVHMGGVYGFLVPNENASRAPTPGRRSASRSSGDRSP